MESVIRDPQAFKQTCSSETRSGTSSGSSETDQLPRSNVAAPGLELQRVAKGSGALSGLAQTRVRSARVFGKGIQIKGEVGRSIGGCGSVSRADE